MKYQVVAYLTPSARFESAKNLKQHGQGSYPITSKEALRLASEMTWSFRNKKSAISFAKQARKAPGQFTRVVVKKGGNEIYQNMSEKRLLKLKRQLRKRAKKLRLGKKRTGAYVFGTLRRVRGNPAKLHFPKPIDRELYKISKQYNPRKNLYVVLVDGKPTRFEGGKKGMHFYTRGRAMKVARYSLPGAKIVSATDYLRSLGENPTIRPIDEKLLRLERRISPGEEMYVVMVRGEPLRWRDGLKGMHFYSKQGAMRIARRFSGSILPVSQYRKIARKLRRNPDEYARQIPRESRPMKGRGFSGKFDTSAGSTHADLANFIAGGRDKWARTIGANTVVRRYNDGSIGVILYQTRILHYHPNGSVDVNFGGYMTATTFSRINSLIPYGWRVRKKGGKLALENSWGQRAVVRQPRAGEEYSIKLTEDKAYLID